MPELVVDALLFDLDGTLVDSSASVRRAWLRVADELSIPFEGFEPLMHGIPVAQVFASVEPELPPAEVARLAVLMNERQAEDVDVTPIPGAGELLDGLPSARWAIVTSGDRRLATSRIAAGGLATPRVLITADDVPVGKPDPAPYLLAARRLGVDPARCLVIEDAPAGVAAGRAAGCAVLGVLTSYPRLDGVIDAVPDLTTVRADADRLGVHVTVG